MTTTGDLMQQERLARLDDKLRTLQETYEALPASNPVRATNCA
jgi:hypothetical protein